MGFELKRKEPVEEGLRRIIIEEIDDALDLLKTSRGGIESIHEVRKHIKKIRTVLRHLRNFIPKSDYEYENTYFRDLGHQLSDARDSQILIDTIESLENPGDAHHAIKKKLTEQRDAVRDLLKANVVFPHLVEKFSKGRDRIKALKCKASGWRAFRRSLRQAYERGQKTRETALTHGTFENFHEWRKRVKDLTYTARLLRPLWPDIVGALAEHADKLSEVLGDEHDLGVLDSFLRTNSAAGGRGHEALAKQIAQQRNVLRKQAEPLGKKLYADKPDVFVKRIEALWHAW